MLILREFWQLMPIAVEEQSLRYSIYPKKMLFILHRIEATEIKQKCIKNSYYFLIFPEANKI